MSDAQLKELGATHAFVAAKDSGQLQIELDSKR